MIYPTYQEIKIAHKKINKYIHHTAVLTNKSSDKLTDSKLYFKCENFQRMGAFKMRGAMHKLLQLNSVQRSKGVATHSSGNFAQALALSARILNIAAFIVMPENAPEVKKKAVNGYGGKIYECESTLESREKTANQITRETGAILCHPYNDMDVILGNSSACIELMEEAGKLDAIIAPVGGGGLLSGTAIAAKRIDSSTEVYGAEPMAADDAYRSFKAGKIIPSVNPNTIADGLKTSLGEINFPIIQDLVNDIIRVEEEEIVQAMIWIWERMKIIVEPSAAVSFAAVLKRKELFKDKRVGLILSGGNVELTNLPF
jgi:threonine dehydratase